MAKPLSCATAAAMALPMRPSGAKRLIRIGWSWSRMQPFHGERRSAAQRRRSGPGSMRPNHFLQQHVGTEVAVRGALAALRHALARGLLEEGVGVLLALDVLRRRRHMVEDGDKVEVGLVPALVDVVQDIIALDPALRLLELHV